MSNAVVLLLSVGHDGPRGVLELPGVGPWWFGRSQEADVMLADPYVSKIHFVLARQQQAMVVADVGSSNGTYVNGHRVTSTEIPLDARIRLGRSVIQLCKSVPPADENGSVPRLTRELLAAAGGIGVPTNRHPAVDHATVVRVGRTSGIDSVRGALVGLGLESSGFATMSAAAITVKVADMTGIGERQVRRLLADLEAEHRVRARRAPLSYAELFKRIIGVIDDG